jgi:hypothetical protein
LLMQEQVDAERMELGQKAYEVLERAAEPIDGLGHDHPEASTRGIFAKRIEGWSVLSRLCPAYTFVAVELDNLPTHTFGDLAKFAFLVLGGLMVGGNAGVNRNGSHGLPSEVVRRF